MCFVRLASMLYETASAILNSYPRPRVRITLKTGEVLETPRPLLATCGPKSCSISTDGHRARFLRWAEIESFEKVEPTTVEQANG
jgi:hypothetical protein